MAGSRRFLMVTVLAAMLPALAVPAPAAERVALVIGNAAYEQEAAVLRNPVNDAAAVAAVLRRLGFEVIEGRDLDRDEFFDQIAAFDKAGGGAEIALFFYAGHGLQVDGRNYLAPVDMKLETRQDLRRSAIELGAVLEVMRSETNLLILDACRNNPLAGDLARSLGLSRATAASRGLARVQSASGTLIAYATEPGSVAADGAGKHSPYTSALLEHLETPGLSVNDLFTQVTASVLSRTGGKQKPWTHASLAKVVRLVAAAPPPPSEACDRELDLEYWRSVKDSTRAADYEAYVSSCPQGQFVRLARNRIQALRDAADPHPEVPSTTPQAQREAEAKARRDAEERRRRQEWERLGLVMVRVDGGSFIMGCQNGRDSECDEDEKPAHRVQLRSFEIGKYEVTQELWEKVMGGNPSHFGGCPECPVERVSWDDIHGFLAGLNARTEGGYRLLTEAEWEYAARGGRQSRGYRYAGGNDVASVAWYSGNGGGKTHPVGQKRANELGLHDMSGNVREWVQDCWNASYRGTPDDGRSSARGDCSRRVVRGGSWVSFPRNLRASNRYGDTAGNRVNFLGFRIARTLTP